MKCYYKYLIFSLICTAVIVCIQQQNVYAYTWQDVEDYINTSIEYYGNTGSLKGFKNQFLNNANNYQVLKNTIEITNYDTIICGYNSGTGSAWNNSKLYFLNSNNNKISKGNTFTFQGTMTGIYIDLGTWIGYNSTFNNISALTTSNYSGNEVYLYGDKPFVLSDVSVYTDVNYTTIANDVIQKQAYNYIVSRGNEIDLNNKTYPYPIADARLGSAYNFSQVTFNMYYYNDLEVRIDYNGTLEYYTQTIDNYTSIIIAILNEENANKIVNGQTYYLEMLIDDTLNNISNTFTLYYTYSGTGEEEQPSGDTIINIDLSQTNQKLDNIEQAIKSGDNKIIQAIESGEKKAEERQTFWEKAYNDLFYVSGEEIENKITNLYEKLELPSGELEEAIAGLNQITNQYGDFIIKWENYTPNFSVKNQPVNIEQPLIPSGEINFNQLERENKPFQDTMKYARAILSFSIIVLLTKNLWQTILTTLGISTQIYDKATEEQRTAKANEEKWKADFEKQRYNEWLRKNNNRK